MNTYQSFATNPSAIGSSHEKHGKECQDYCHHGTNSDMSFAIVADGHGSDDCFRSAKGSKLAEECARIGMIDFVKYLNEPEEKQGFFYMLKKNIPRKEGFSKEQAEKCLKERLIRGGIIRAWHKRVAENFEASPFAEEELKAVGENFHHAYGTTLIAAAIAEDFWFGIHIGDGRLTALYPDGTYEQPVPWDERCFLNRTTSICDDDAGERARCYFSFCKDKPLPIAVFLCTDGIDDNYPVESNEECLFKLYRTIALTFAEDGFDSTEKQLKELAKSFATKGKGDDASIAGFVDMEGLRKIKPILEKQIAEEEK
jgi:serine/threonine protein phosphatase PrpC